MIILIWIRLKTVMGIFNNFEKSMVLDPDQNIDTRTRKFFPSIDIEEIFDDTCANKHKSRDLSGLPCA